MKCIIMNHKDGGSYVMDAEGVFHFVSGYTEMPVGAEITLGESAKKKADRPKFKLPLNLMRAAAAVVFSVMLGGYIYIFSTKLPAYEPDSEETMSIEDGEIPLSPLPPDFEDTESAALTPPETAAIVVSSAALLASGAAVIISLAGRRRKREPGGSETTPE